MNKKQSPSQKKRGATVAAVLCFVAAIAIVGTYTLGNSREARQNEEIARTEENETKDNITEDSADDAREADSAVIDNQNEDKTQGGTAGTGEEQLRYGWNYAELLSRGPSFDALVPSPIMRAMQEGRIARVEELTRIPADVQDTLISILSEKTLPVPELGAEVQALRGFNIIATANNRDKGVNELSSALKRRFNTVVLPVPSSEEEETAIVSKRVAEMGRNLALPAEPPALEEVRRVVRIFRELREGCTEDGKHRLNTPTGSLSPAEAVSVLTNGMALAAHFGNGRVQAADVASSLVGAIVKDPVQDAVVWQEYLERVVKQHYEWDDLYRACRDVE